MNFKRFHESKNLFDEDTIVVGGIAADGSIGANDKMLVSDYIRVNPNTVYTGTYLTTAYYGRTAAYYDTNKNFISTASNNVQSEDGTATYTMTTPSNCYYVRVATNIRVTNHVDDIMFNTGSQPLPYEPYSSEVWHNIPHYIHNTSTDTLTTLPADVYANDTTATVELKGQMEQSGTPTPSSPIQPQETGERTGNLFDADTIYSDYKQADGTFEGTARDLSAIQYKAFTADDVGKTFTFTFDIVSTSATNVRASANINGSNVNGNSLSGAGTTTVTFTVATANDYIRINYSSGGTNSLNISNIMLNTGSQPLPYEPYGYKIPILNNSQTTNVYLGEVQTTRKIKKLVLTGDENWYIEGSDIFYTDIMNDVYRTIPICSHFKGVLALKNNNDITISLSMRINIKTDYVTHTVNDFKTYLQQQYAAGTPVTVWYVLATETTGIVNEPLRKIGNYADEVSGITIPTIAGANTISIDTTLQPSEVTVNYKGWHPVQSVHERENGAWD